MWADELHVIGTLLYLFPEEVGLDLFLDGAAFAFSLVIQLHEAIHHPEQWVQLKPQHALLISLQPLHLLLQPP